MLHTHKVSQSLILASIQNTEAKDKSKKQQVINHTIQQICQGQDSSIDV